MAYPWRYTLLLNATGYRGHLPTFSTACGFSGYADEIGGLEDRKWHFQADRLGKSYSRVIIISVRGYPTAERLRRHMHIVLYRSRH